jgi:hypothetical protein
MTNFLRLKLQIRKFFVYPSNDSHSPRLLDPSVLTQEDENMPQSDPSPPLKTHELPHLDHLLQNLVRLPQWYDLSPQKPLKKRSILDTRSIISVTGMPKTKEKLIESALVKIIRQP